MRLPAFVCLSICLLARLLKNACMDLDEMLHVDRRHRKISHQQFLYTIAPVKRSLYWAGRQFVIRSVSVNPLIPRLKPQSNGPLYSDWYTGR